MAPSNSYPAAWPANDTPALSNAENLLRAGKPFEALASLPPKGSDWVVNARGVCLLRLGRVFEAVETLKPLVYAPNSITPLRDAHPLFRANFATALLLDGNAEGFDGALGDIRDDSHPYVSRLRAAVRRARGPLWMRVLFLGLAGKSIALDFPPGAV